MIAWLWLTGLVRRRFARLLAGAGGVALAVALLASIASFLSGALATMTLAATRQVAVDWQVEAHVGTDPAVVIAAVRADPQVERAVPVEYADTTGLQAATGGSVQTTGGGVVVGVPAGYALTFPGSVRVLAGDANGVLLAQQTAANLHTSPGDTITIGRSGLDAVTVRVDGVVDLPQADSLFQKVGSPPGAQASAPPDNAVVVPADRWHALFDALGAARPDLVRHQVHAALTRRLPPDPAAAFNQVSGAARHLEAALAGGASVGDNMAAALDAARSDALYAQVLFILLGVPGVLLAGLLSTMATAAAADRRRREYALLRLRGATAARMVRTAAVEAAVVAFLGGGAGLGAAALIGRAAFGSATFGSSRGAAVLWAAIAALAGVGVASAALVVPAWRDARRLTIAGARRLIGHAARPWWQRLGIDVWLLGASGLVFWLASRAGYQVVLVPEGLPTLSVNYWALAGPLLFWVGAGLLAWRLADLLFGAGRRLVSRVARPLAHGLSELVASSLARHRRRLAAPCASSP